MTVKRFQSKYPFRHLLCYIPKRYVCLQNWQKEQRTIIEDFKNGHATQDLYQRFANAIKTIITKHTGQWIVTFIPPTVGYEVEYDWRYKELASYLQEHLPEIPVAYRSVMVADEWSSAPKNLGGRRTIETGNLAVNAALFRNKSVILIDDIITTGYSFRTVGDALTAAGAIRIYGVILAMTIHPNLPIKNRKITKKQY